MNLSFFKYQGTGNDFVMVDDRQESFPIDKALIAHLCHRRFGIGADGLILIRKAEGYDFRMVYFNSDGGEGSMCGNGGRCAVRFAHDLGLFAEEATFIAVDGPHQAAVRGDIIHLNMSPVTEVTQAVGYDFMNTGSPHYVAYVDSVANTEVVTLGKAIRYGEEFGPLGGTNVNFIELKAPNHLAIRTYERGVEDETYSCGTGVTAGALSAHLHHGWASPIAVDTLGGKLEVAFEANGGEGFQNICLSGPAQRVFEGQVEI
ncbi:diaminopimelate epimerase [Dyadobacter jejuensis]|uniref:Diaminopimelate epimerase n=1 Tax=Dyadobacter jejuensis TaxID=1082580 RepID=A0A316AIW1_9BACT|nr:diaminopimelate epimerase [Dyadobacter jejuensis]PWJ56820.1 diaminopimelate epimerase [Dyadobacter jejuensis]